MSERDDVKVYNCVKWIVANSRSVYRNTPSPVLLYIVGRENSLLTSSLKHAGTVQVRPSFRNLAQGGKMGNFGGRHIIYTTFPGGGKIVARGVKSPHPLNETLQMCYEDDHISHVC